MNIARYKMNQNKYARVLPVAINVFSFDLSSVKSMYNKIQEVLEIFCWVQGMMYQFQTLSMHLINQDHWIQLIQGAHVLEIALSTLPLLLLFNPKGKIHRKLSHLLKRSTNPKDLCNRYSPAFGSFHFYRRKTSFLYKYILIINSRMSFWIWKLKRF